MHIFIQSMVPQLTELSFYYQNLVTVSRLQRKMCIRDRIQMVFCMVVLLFFAPKRGFLYLLPLF